MYIMNEECMDRTWCTRVVCEVRVGGEENFEPLCSTKMATC